MLRKESQITKLDIESLYRVKRKGYNRAAEGLKQRIKAKAATLKRYKNRVNHYRQNKLFQSNQSKFYQELDGKSHEENIIPNNEKTREFWSGIWERNIKHNENADWIQKVAEEMHGNKQQSINITPTKIKERIRKISNWKAPGPDGVHGYWIKMLVSMQERIALHLQSCITRGEVPDWMTTGRTVLLLKDKSKGNEMSNYRPITCLPPMWKLITGIVADEIYNHLEENDLLPEEQKSCRRNSRGTKDQLLIDKAVMKNRRRRKVGLSMVWIDYRKAYDMVAHSWIKKSMERCGISFFIQEYGKLANNLNVRE